MRTVNEAGIAEIRRFLAEHHRRGEDFTVDMLHAWARDAEFQMGEGNPPSIEIRSFDSRTGAAIEYTITPAGVDEEG